MTIGFVFDQQELGVVLSISRQSLRFTEEALSENSRDRMISLVDALQEEAGLSKAEAVEHANSTSSFEIEVQQARRTAVVEALGYFEFFLKQLHTKAISEVSVRDVREWRFAKIAEAGERFDHDFALKVPFAHEHWKLIKAVSKARNCIVHAAGYVDRDFDEDDLAMLRKCAITIAAAEKNFRGRSKHEPAKSLVIGDYSLTVIHRRLKEFAGALMLCFDEPRSSLWCNPPDKLIDRDFQKKIAISRTEHEKCS